MPGKKLEEQSGLVNVFGTVEPRNFRGSIIVVDEVQNLTPEAIEEITNQLGVGLKLGSPTEHRIGNESLGKTEQRLLGLGSGVNLFDRKLG